MGLLSSNHASRASFTQVRQLARPVRHERQIKSNSPKAFHVKTWSKLDNGGIFMQNINSKKYILLVDMKRLYEHEIQEETPPKQDLSARLTGSL